MSWRASMILVALMIVYRLVTGSHGDDLFRYRKTAEAFQQSCQALVALEVMRIAEADGDLPRLRASQAAIRQINSNEAAERDRLQALDHAITAMSGETGMQEVRRLTDIAEQEESRLLAARSRQSETQGVRSQRSAAVGGVILLILLGMATLVLELDLRKRRRAERAVRESEERLRQANESLERRVAQRTTELAEANLGLELANKELEAFSYSVSHDLRAPLRSVNSFSQIVLEEYADKLDEEGVRYLERVRAGAQNMGQLIEDLLNLSRLSRAPLRREVVNLSTMAANTVNHCRDREPERKTSADIAPDLRDSCDPRLMQVVLNNLLGNAWKYSGKREDAHVEFGVMDRGGSSVYFVRDNGAGFDMAYAGQLFAPFQRLHTASEFEGTGIGLATVQRIISRHGGRVWAESSVGNGATFYFTLTPELKQMEPSLCQTNSFSS